MSDPFDGAERSLGQLVASATAEMSALVHDEIALAKAEVRQDVKRGGIGAILGVVALVVLLFSLPMLSFALAYGFNSWTGGHNGDGGWNLAWCFLLSFLVSCVLTVLLGVVAWMKFKKVKPPTKSIASAKETAAVLSTVKPHPRPEQAKGLDKTLDKAATVARSSV
ncbi:MULTISPECIES: phage holin family protein [unclassified Streptomyces]|uniref:phage holin family protein n=1 Tax=unclassified Streptomyces TaxID=2593676 RepID=UPI00166131D3|nr:MULTISPECIES: phage holin family protein [unclassified Streptomyces]MBD0712100.1 transporter [Streptomyces sp. CBMA291]MBD0717915.1 transporter [Streptomyces sp. CBMA370]